MSINEFQSGNTVEVTWQSSIAPDSAPTLVVKNGELTAIDSITMISSDATHYFYPYTIPSTPESYLVAETVAVKTFNGSARNFISREGFKIIQTNPL